MDIIRKETLFSWLWRKLIKRIYHSFTLLLLFFTYSCLKAYKEMAFGSTNTNNPFSNLRVQYYRWCGYKIAKHTFIRMCCYLDDMCYDKIEIGDNVTIS